MTVTINGRINTDYDLDFIHKEIAPPEAKTYSISIPLTDGDVDLTDTVSPYVRYNNREITIVFEIRKDRKEWPSLMAELYREWHGKSVEVVFSDDSAFCWRGRASVGALEDHVSTASVTVTVNAEPYKKTLAKTSVRLELDEDREMWRQYIIECSTAIAIPYFYLDVNGSVEVDFDGTGIKGIIQRTSMSENERIYGAQLRYGSNSISVRSVSGINAIRLELEGGDL